MEGVKQMIDYKDLAERCISTFLQATGGMIAVDQIVDMGADQWKLVLGAGGAAVLSMLKGYVAARFTGDNSCSLITGKDLDHELDAMYGEEV